MGTTPATDELRVAAATALGEAAPDARSEAANILLRAFTRPTSPRGAPSAAFLVAIGRSLLTLRVSNATSLVRDRAEGLPDAVKRQLLAIIQR